jgi:hypothetical protein
VTGTIVAQEYRAQPGDLVQVTGYQKSPRLTPGMVLELDGRWTLVQWFDAHHEGQPKAWTQWYPRAKLSVISTIYDQ